MRATIIYRLQCHAMSWRMLLCMVLLCVGLQVTPAQAAQRTHFDHLTTGFELIGQHRDLPCESCHANAVFKGTPHDCAACHGVGTVVKATAKQTGHIFSSDRCDSCHTPVGFRPVVNFDHAETRGSCSFCHDGVQARGQGPTHMETSLQCNACHSTVSWSGALFRHTNVTGGCVDCHDGPGATATVKPPTHIPTAAAGCESCHGTSNFVSFAMLNKSPPMNHAVVSSLSCATCHEAGLLFVGAPAVVTRPLTYGNPPQNHPLGGACNDCHLNTVSFAGATAFPAGHIPLPNGSTSQCSACHANANDYSIYVMDHAVVAGTSCATCHAAGKSFTNMAPPTLKVVPANHVPVASADCTGCHVANNFVSFVITNKSPPMNHAVVSGTSCATCHASGLTFVGTPPVVTTPNNHIPIGAAACDACHDASNFLSFAIANTSPAPMNHAAVSGMTCSTCHGSTGAGYVAPVKMMPGNHVPVGSAACESCHLSSNLTTFAFSNVSGTAPAAMVHSVVSSTACSTCHEAGRSFVGTPPTVLRPALKANGQAHTQNGECSTCHFNTTTFKGASDYPTNHIPLPNGQASNCASCHTNASDLSLYVMDHAVVAGTTCATCHAAGLSFANMAPPNLKVPPGNHVPIGSAACEACHAANNFVSFVITNKSPPMNHAVVGSTSCATCHASGLSFVGAPPVVTTPTNHVPIGSAACDACHSGSNFANFVFSNISGTAPPAMVHSVVSSMVCSSCHEAGKSFVGAPPTKVRPTLKANGQAHTPNGECSACHFNTVSFKGATDLPTNHIPLTNGASSNCAACHSNANDFSVYAMDHSVVSATCSTCHAAGLSFANMAPPKLKVPPGNHIPFGTAACTACHLSTNFTTFVIANTSPTPMNHASVSAMTCSTCHGSAGAGFVAPVKMMPGNHVPIGSAACEGCHLGSNFTTFAFSNQTGTAPPAMVHGLVTAMACSTCHEAGKSWVGSPTTKVRPALKANGQAHVNSGECSTCHFNTVSFKGATDLPANHLPIPAADNNNCSLCHSNASNYSIGKMNHVNITSNCAQCHGYGLSFANMAPPTLVQPPSGATGHIPSNPPTGTNNFACEQCHSASNFTTFAGTVMKHAVVRGMTCMSCHELGMKWKTNTGVRLWVRDGANHHKGQDCGGSGCHSTRDKMAIRRAQLATSNKSALGADRAPSLGNSTALAGRLGEFDHRRVSGSDCASCHNPSQATGKPATHIATGNQCGSCHTTLHWLPVQKVDHAQVVGSCASCHNGVKARGLSSSHVASSNACAMCHTTNGWLPAHFDHAGVTAACHTCHDSVRAIGKPGNHVPTTQECSSCHGVLMWSPAKLDHTTLLSACASCHNNTIATGKSMGHMSLQADCAGCHRYPAWSEVSFKHTSVVYPGDHSVSLTCIACHTSNADTIPWRSAAEAGSCGGCHAADYQAAAHPKTLNGSTYTASELHTCTGACHVYKDELRSEVAKSLPGPYHKVADAAFKH